MRGQESDEDEEGRHSLENVRAIDAICDRFEAALRQGERPDIRAELEQADPEFRAELFRELLGIQLSVLAKPGERPGLGTLLGEFPEYRDEILQAVSASSNEVTTVIFAASPGDTAARNEEILREIQPEERYRVEGEVARGGMGVIHLAEDPALRRRVAVKTMLATNASPDELARFIEEAQITGQLDHPGIVPVHELGVDESGAPFYSMKYVRGRDLLTILEGLRKEEPELVAEFPLHRLLSVFDRVCDAVGFAHAHGVIHRDLKPGNIRAGEFGEVLVMDWGLAKLIGRPEESTAAEPPGTRQVSSMRGEEESGEFHTLAGSIMGSPQYMAPEQAAGETGSLDQRTDIYALGAILYEILTLTTPVELKDDVYQTLDSVTAGKIKSPLRLNRSPSRRRARQLPHCPGNRVPEALGTVAMKALALDRKDRYETVGALHCEIEAWLGGYATEAERAGLFRQVKLFVGRNKVASIAAAIIAVLLVAGSIINFQQRNAAVAAKGVAETALANYEESERQKSEQAKASAPAYLKSALALEQKGDFDSALITAEGALGFDPELIDGQRVRCLLLAQAGRFEESLSAARNLPSEGLDADLAELLEKIVANPELNHLPALATLAGELEMPTTATDFLAQSWKINQGRYAEDFPVWRSKLELAWGKLSVYQFGITKEDGLRLSLNPEKKQVVTSLEPVRGIPLQTLYLQNVNITDLSPLRGLPVQKISVEGGPLHSLDGLEGSPLRSLWLKFNWVSSHATDFLEALRGQKEIEEIVLWMRVETAPLADVQARSIWISKPTSLAFLHFQKDLRIYGGQSPLDRDWTPLLSYEKLESLEPGTFPFMHGDILEPIFRLVAAEQLESAGEELRKLRSPIKSRALEHTRATLDLIEVLIGRRAGKDAVLSRESPIIKITGDRVFAKITIHGDLNMGTVMSKALEVLGIDLASIHNDAEQEIAKEFAVAGAGTPAIIVGGMRTRSEPEWRWQDGTPWDFDRLIRGPILVGAIQWCAVTVDGPWRPFTHLAGAQSILIQFPVEWMQQAAEPGGGSAAGQ